MTSLLIFSRNKMCAVEKSVYIKEACKDSNTGDFISTMGSTYMYRWSKALRQRLILKKFHCSLVDNKVKELVCS